MLAACTAAFGSDTQFVAPLLADVRSRSPAATLFRVTNYAILGVAATVVAGGGLLLQQEHVDGPGLDSGIISDGVGASVVGLLRRIEISSYVRGGSAEQAGRDPPRSAPVPRTRCSRRSSSS